FLADVNVPYSLHRSPVRRRCAVSGACALSLCSETSECGSGFLGGELEEFEDCDFSLIPVLLNYFDLLLQSKGLLTKPYLEASKN
ncbi:hypothetical protein scyTo_0018017, partial [Scyliorhinus torazame]|nr:hypothetical protein [Scyliorhinus torazame]